MSSAESQRRSRAANPARARAYDRRYYAANREKRQESSRKWRTENPEKVAVLSAQRATVRGTFLKRWKLAAGCFDCGYNAATEALDFDHVQGAKIFNVGMGLTRSWKSILAEIAKCVVRCSNCHRVASKQRRTA